MDYNTLKDILWNMPETFEEVLKTNTSMADVIKQDVILNALIKKGIFKDRDDYFNQCQNRYDEIRNETIRQLEEQELYNDE
jgi:hypothetical protein